VFTRLALCLSVVCICSCGPAAQPHSPSPATKAATPSPSNAPASSASPAQVQPAIFVIVLENHDLSQLRAGPYLNMLANQYAVATNYHDVGSPSAPNYLGMTSGETWGLNSDAYINIPTHNDLGDQLTVAHINWRAYMEDLPSDCRTTTSSYAVKHDPFAYYNGACPANVVPLTSLSADLHSPAPPSFVWITPNLCNDDHNCDVSVGDAWLAQTVPAILASAGWKAGGVLFIVSDEGAGGSAAAVAVSNRLTAHSTNAHHDHYSLLATIEDWFGLPRVGNAKSAAPFTDLLANHA
jgi:acid phosphatase